MINLADIIISSGRSAVELALFVILPVMIVMLSIMRLAEAFGLLDRLINLLAPLTRPLGLPGVGLLALIQNILVSAFAPLATLAMMDKSDLPRRQIAATLALVLGTAQANAVFPLSALGLNGLATIGISVVAGFIGAAATYYLFARHLPVREVASEPAPNHAQAEDAKTVLAVINKAGAEAFRIAVGALPMLVLSLVLVNVLRTSGGLGALESLLAPLFSAIDLPAASALLVVTKFIAGGSAMMAVAVEFVNTDLMLIGDVNRLAGFLIHPLDIAGVAILLSAGPRVAEVARPAMAGAVVAILIRTAAHGVLFS
ncbi:MAG: nucleoside recognition domain-containing protein [Magnetovibrionaceae bacterium]